VGLDLLLLTVANDDKGTYNNKFSRIRFM